MNMAIFRTSTGAHRAASESWQFEAKHASSIRTGKLETTGWADELATLRGSHLFVSAHYSLDRMLAPMRDMGLIADLPLVLLSQPSRLDPVAQEFRDLAEKWKRETAFVGSLSEKVLHPAYQRIIAMGPPVVGHVLRELAEAPDHWFWALRFLTGIDAAESEDTIDGAQRAWIEWGRDRGFLN